MFAGKPVTIHIAANQSTEKDSDADAVGEVGSCLKKNPDEVLGTEVHPDGVPGVKPAPCKHKYAVAGVDVAAPVMLSVPNVDLPEV